MSQGWTVGRKLFAGIGALAALVMLGGVVSYWQLSAIKRELDATAKVQAKRLEISLALAERVKSIQVDERSLILGALANDEAVSRRAQSELTTHMSDANRMVAELEALLHGEEGLRALAEIRSVLAQWDGVRNEMAALIGSGAVTEAWTAANTKSTPLLDGAKGHVETLVKQQQEQMRASLQSGEGTFAQATWTVVGVIGLSMIVVCVVVWVVRHITGDLRQCATELGDGAHQVSSASQQVSTAAQSLSQGATEQAASLEQTSASMEQMASMTRKNAENSQHAATLMQGVDTRVQESNKALDEMVASMGAIKESSDRISRIIKTIDEIAFQTNILALNAAVEAARAGEAGMGFAVVADEVRSLAQRSAQAARDTAGLIEESIAKSTEGTTRVQQVASVIRGITHAVGEVKGLVDEVSVASRQQAQGIDQVTQAIAQMEKVTQNTAATAEESAAASEELSAQAETSMSIVAELTAMVGGGTRRRAATSAARTAMTGSAGRAAAVVRMTPRMRVDTRTPTPEELIPLDDTGTFGKF